jgi:hypothetical protein
MPTLDLDWRAPRSCPQEASVRAEVARLVGASPASVPRLIAQGTVLQQASHRWALTLRTVADGVSGERVLVGQSCRAVTEAAVVTLALTLNPDLILPEPDSESFLDPTLAPNKAATGCNADTPRRDSSADGEMVHWLVASLVGPRWGLFHRPVEEYGLGIGANPGRIEVWLEGVLGSGTVSSAKPGAHAEFWFASFRALGCYSIAPGSLDFLPCGGLDWTRAQGRAAGFDNSGQGSMSWNSLLLGAKLDWRFHHAWRLELKGLGLIALARPRAYVTHGVDEDLLRPSSLGASATLGIQWQFR